jgi:hypothetical protein
MMAGKFAGKNVLVTGSCRPAWAVPMRSPSAREGAHLILADLNEAGLAESKALVEERRRDRVGPPRRYGVGGKHRGVRCRRAGGA